MLTPNSYGRYILELEMWPLALSGKIRGYTHLITCVVRKVTELGFACASHVAKEGQGKSAVPPQCAESPEVRMRGPVFSDQTQMRSCGPGHPALCGGIVP